MTSASWELAEYGQFQNTINSNLVYTVQKNISHGSGKVGELIIKTASDGNGQGNSPAMAVIT